MKSNSSNFNFQEALIAFRLLNGIRFSYPKKREFLADFHLQKHLLADVLQNSFLKNFENFTGKFLVKLQA